MSTFLVYIQAAKQAAEKAEKERIAREEAQKRFDAYWAEHASEKENLENERENLKSQIKEINDPLSDQIASLNKEIAAIPGGEEINNFEARISKLREEKNNLGIFKGKEKKALQEQIDQAEAGRSAVKSKMENAKKEIEAKIADLRAEAQKKISPLQNRIAAINSELNKAR